MDIGFSEEQELLRESARRFLENQCETQFVREPDGRAERAKASEVAFGDAT